MKFEFHCSAMRMTPETDREHRILQEEFRYESLKLPAFQYATTYDADFVKRVIERLQRFPPMWVDP